MSSNLSAGQDHGHAQAKTENAVDSAKDTANVASDKVAEATGASEGQAQLKKEENASYLQQTGESVVNAAQGALDGVKNTLGVGQQKK